MLWQASKPLLRSSRLLSRSFWAQERGAQAGGSGKMGLTLSDKASRRRPTTMPVLFPSNRHSVPPVLCLPCPGRTVPGLFWGGPQVAGFAIGNCVSSLRHPCRDQIKSDACAEDVVTKPDTEFFFFSEGCHFSVNVQDISTIQAESRYRITLPFIDYLNGIW